jgi:hypothetical protein
VAYKKGETYLKQVFQIVYGHELEKKYPKNHGSKKLSKYQTGQKGQLQNFDCALGVFAWVHIFTAVESVPTRTACYAASANPWTETI